MEVHCSTRTCKRKRRRCTGSNIWSLSINRHIVAGTEFTQKGLLHNFDHTCVVAHIYVHTIYLLINMVKRKRFLISFLVDSNIDFFFLPLGGYYAGPTCFRCGDHWNFFNEEDERWKLYKPS